MSAFDSIEKEQKDKELLARDIADLLEKRGYTDVRLKSFGAEFVGINWYFRFTDYNGEHSMVLSF